jgi:hypothetical protein
MLYGVIRNRCVGIVALIILITMSLGCEQDIELPRPGTPEVDVRRLLGEPTRTEAESRERIEFYVTRLNECAGIEKGRVRAVLLYEREWRKEVLIAVDAEKRVLCAGHGGVTFIQ